MYYKLLLGNVVERQEAEFSAELSETDSKHLTEQQTGRLGSNVTVNSQTVTTMSITQQYSTVADQNNLNQTSWTSSTRQRTLHVS